MTKIPDIVIIIGQNKEINAVLECIKLNIATITVVDTTCDPTITNFPIPANDDAMSSIKFVLNYLCDAIYKKETLVKQTTKSEILKVKKL